MGDPLPKWRWSISPLVFIAFEEERVRQSIYFRTAYYLSRIQFRYETHSTNPVKWPELVKDDDKGQIR